MIKVERSRVEEPQELSGKKEKDLCIQHVNANKRLKDFSFQVYKKAKPALEKLFHGKCAYCESQILHIYVGDVEHFRPKRGVTEDSNHLGYYWLAQDWDNLLLSCRNCNQPSTQVVDGEEKSIGKGNKFPLNDEEKRMQGPDSDLLEEEKVRLLINPCKEDPEEFFEYHEQEGNILTKPLKAEKKEMAEASIEVYALQRHHLVQNRRKKLIAIRTQIEAVKKAALRLNEAIERTKRIVAEHELKEELVRLHAYTRPDQEYAGMARFIINKFIEDFTS